MLSSRGQADELPVINMTPMVNVILCLLVFFMAATRLYDWDESEFAVNVPEVSEAAPATAAPDDWCSPSSSAAWSRSRTLPMTSTISSRSCATHGREYVNQGVVIRGDRSLSYQDLADVLSACDEAGIRTSGCLSAPAKNQPAESLSHEIPVCGQHQQHDGAANEFLLDLVHTLINVDAATINSYAQRPRALALRGPVRDHLRGDRVGRNAVFARRLAAFRRRRGGCASRFTNPAGTGCGAAWSSRRYWETPSIIRSAATSARASSRARTPGS